MTYNLNSQLDAQNARTRLEYLIKRKCVIELTEKKTKRTLSQNAYLHLLLGYFAVQTGNTLEWVKQQYYKRLCNPDLFLAMKEDQYLGRIAYVVSSADLNTEEMSLSIDRFKNWAALEAGIYLPDADDEEKIAAMQIEVERHKTYVY